MTSLESTSPPQLESTVWPPCILGFIWVAGLNACVPESEVKLRPQPRTYFTNGCPVGFYMHVRYRECIRMKYHASQQPGRIKNWYDTTPKPKRDPPKYRIRTTTIYAGEWFGYHAGWGKDVTRP